MPADRHPERVLTPSMIGQYIGYDSCPRYFRYRTTDADMRHDRNWWDDESVGVFLSEVGTSFEADQLRALADDAAAMVGLPNDESEFDFEFDETWATADEGDDESRAQKRELWESENRPLLKRLIWETAARSPGDGPTVLYQLPMRGRIEYWDVSGLSDILVLYPTDHNDTIRSLLLEVKSSWSEKSAHQIQAAVYSLLFDHVVADLDYDNEAAAAIVHREQDLRDLYPSDGSAVDTFDLDSRITEVRRLLREDGELHSIYQKEFEDVGFRLDRKCDGCEFNEICFTKAVESKDPALLGLTQGDRQRLVAHGIDTLDEFADLYEREEDKRPYDFAGLPVADGSQDTVRSLGEYGTLGNRLAELVQRAQLLSGELDPPSEEFDFVEFLKGTGNGKLPEDSPRGSASPPYPEEGLIRVYLYVQPDYVRDRLVLAGARIDGHNVDASTVVELAEELPMGKEDSRRAEEGLLKGFFTQLFRELRDVAEETEYPDDVTDGEGYFHLYFYSQHERDALFEAVRRHPTLTGSDAIRDLLGLREGLDQAMVSVLHNEVTERLALHYPGTGLVQTVDQMVTEGWRVEEGYHDLTSWGNDQWKTTVDGNEVDLQEVFRNGLFERYKPYREREDSIELMLGGSGSDDPDGFYPVRNRFGSQIPLEYIWGACGELTAFLEEDDPPTQQSVEAAEDPATDLNLDERVFPYLYRDHHRLEGRRHRIERADVEALCGQLCYALEHVERSIRFKNAFLGKHSLPVDLPTFGLPDVPLATACQEYLSLEHATDEQNHLDHYMDTPLERVKSGESTFFRVTDVRERESRFGTKFRIEGELLYQEHFDTPSRVLDSCKVSGGDGSSSGSWMVITPLEPGDDGGFDQVGIGRPGHIRHSPNVTVEEFDRQRGRIVVTADEEPSFYGQKFVTWHRGLTGPAEYTRKDNQHYWAPIEEGSVFIADPYADSWPHERAYFALDHAGTNYLYSLLHRAYNGGQGDQFDVGFRDPTVIEGFLDDYEAEMEVAPKGKQREFIEHADQAVTVLQGPPGTGKTSYTLAPAVLSRLYAFETDDATLTAGITAPSHTAVNEALESVQRRLQEYQNATGTDDLEHVELFRVGGSGDGIPGDVPHVDYHNSSDVTKVKDALESTDRDDAHVLLFATPTSMRGLVDKLVKQGYAPADGAEEFMAAGGSIYDLLVVDEASMLDLPNTLLVGAFLADGGQTMFIGDHRQMEPVQVHEWETEDRRTIEENVPFMSALNFVRFLRGDLSELDFTERQSPEVGDAIPMTGLDRTYRMHKLLADILTDLVYTDDGIELVSDQTATLTNVQPSTPAVDRAMDPDAPVVLIVHDEDTSQDANLTEVAIVEALLSALREDPDTDVGVVTPHNAQKGRLRDRVGDRAMVNTVEKFQGGERDAIFVSATASDPDYVRAESDFLLNPNRLNVAMSRMKKKLVVIASESVFRVIPTDASEYDEAIIWKRLYGEMGVLDTIDADARVPLVEFLPDGVESPIDDEETSVAIYTLRSD